MCLENTPPMGENWELAAQLNQPSRLSKILLKANTSTSAWGLCFTLPSFIDIWWFFFSVGDVCFYWKFFSNKGMLFVHWNWIWLCQAAFPPCIKVRDKVASSVRKIDFALDFQQKWPFDIIISRWRPYRQVVREKGGSVCGGKGKERER